MQPLGRKKIKSNFEDYHPPKGYVNWWEKGGHGENKKGSRRKQNQKDRCEAKQK